MLIQRLEGVVRYFDQLYMMNVEDGGDLGRRLLIHQKEPTLMQAEMETTLILFCATFLKLLMKQILPGGYY